MDKSKLLPDIQLNLFYPRPTLPRWTQLPPEVREAACELVAQMLSEYFTGQVSSSEQKESCDA